jgi:transcriptional regulator with XRE-family HTH domain
LITILSTIGIRLKDERKRLGYSQTDFGNVGGVTKNTQILYESDKRSPDALYLASLAAIGVDVQYITTGIRSDNLSKITTVSQSVKEGDELLDTLELLEKDVKKAMEIARKRAEQNKKGE